MSPVKQIVLVGHCAADCRMLKSAIERATPGVAVRSVGDMKALETLALACCLLLINRVLSSGWPASAGVELIKLLKASPLPPAMMLLSDFPDAQQQAEAAGAMPGFGKSELGGEKMTQRLQAALGPGL